MRKAEKVGKVKSSQAAGMSATIDRKTLINQIGNSNHERLFQFVAILRRR